MSSYTLNIKVEGGNLSSDQSILTADSIEYIIAAFTFDESWNQLYKTAVFRVGELVYHSPLESDACKIPFEALKEPIMYISVFGVLGDVRATTAELPIQVQNSGYTVCTPSAPTPDPYNYFIERVAELKNEAGHYANCSLEFAENSERAKNKIAEMQEEIAKTEQSVALNSKNAEESAAQSTNALNELLSHEKFLTSLSTEVQSNATIAFDAAERAETAVFTGIENHNHEDNSLAHPNIVEIAKTAKSIALGKANSLCFDTEAQLKDWVAGAFERSDGKTVADLKVGDNLYILELDVPDYWWDGTGIQPLGAEKPDFSDYYRKSEMDARLSDTSFDLMTKSEYNTLYKAGSLDAGRIYFVFEE